jgi:endonuclease/exonuclease/phosphatase family metal-dependent hydrolase
MGSFFQFHKGDDGRFPMIVRMEAFLRKFWCVFSRDEWMARLLNLSKIKEAASEPGLVMIQIDGLGFTQFERAMQNGNMPFLAHLLKREGYINRRHYTGLPSNTPAVQGALFYGVKSCVPAFSFKDSRSGKVFNMFSPESAAAVEGRLKNQGEPLLKGGSAYGNIFTGGAKEAHFCAASMGWGSLLSAINPLAVPLTVMLNLSIFVRALFLALAEFVLAVVDSIRGIWSGKRFLDEIGFIPLRVTICVLLREVIAAGARIDIARGLPVIHLNLGGYDEQAHHRGPSSTFAYWSLRGIDGVIRRAWKAAQRSSYREYDVFIYSDHGQQDTVDYQQEQGRTIKAAVDQILEENASSGQWRTEFNQYPSHWRADLLRNKPGKMRGAPPVENKDAHPRAIVTSLGPVGHIYLPEALLAEEKEKIAVQLVASAKIPIVMIPDGPGRALAWSSGGKFVLPEEADQIIETDHPCFSEVVRDLVELCHHPDSGELMIFGWRKGLKSLTFNGEQGSHAGPGPDETSGFALLPTGALPRSFNGTICTQDLRGAAFYAQGRRNASAVAMSQKSAPAAGPAVMRVMTYNVHGCMGRDGKISPNRIAGIIARHDPDIIALQELDTYSQIHQAEVIAKKLAMTFHFHPSFSVKRGQHGNAVLSKFPIKLVRSGVLPKLPRALFLEPRGALWVEIDVNGCKVQVLNTHLSLSPAEGLLQMQALCGPDWLGSSACQDPVVFCGDLNALSGSKICKQLAQLLKNTHFELVGHRPLKTLPSFYPLSLVDHIFVGPGLETKKIEVPNTALEKISSDHLPLIIDLQIG